MELNFLCPRCETRIMTDGQQQIVDCPSCSVGVRLKEPHSDPALPISNCLVCGAEAMFIQKDINKNFGLAVVLMGSLVIFWNFFWGLAVLVVLAILDYGLYRVLPMVTVCYACKSVYRKLAQNPNHTGYELITDETFEGTGAQPEVVEPTTPASPHVEDAKA